MPGAPRPLRSAVGAVVVGGLCVVPAACRDDSGGGDRTAFCNRVEERLDELRATPQSLEEVEELIALWRDVGADAPLSIEADWRAHVLNFETALEGTDEEEVYARVYATERSSVAVGSWVQDNCGFDWGPITTIVPPAPTTTTVPGAAPTTGPGAATTTGPGTATTTGPGTATTAASSEPTGTAGG